MYVCVCIISLVLTDLKQEINVSGFFNFRILWKKVIWLDMYSIFNILVSTVNSCHFQLPDAVLLLYHAFSRHEHTVHFVRLYCHHHITPHRGICRTLYYKWKKIQIMWKYILGSHLFAQSLLLSNYYILDLFLYEDSIPITCEKPTDVF